MNDAHLNDPNGFSLPLLFYEDSFELYPFVWMMPIDQDDYFSAAFFRDFTNLCSLLKFTFNRRFQALFFQVTFKRMFLMQ